MNRPRTPSIPVGIRSFGYYLPDRCLTNADLVQLGSPVTPEWITQKTGICTRYVADEREAMSDLVIPAAKAALSWANLTGASLDALMVSGDLHDSGGVQLTSALVAQALGLSAIACFDLRAGCPSSILAIHQGCALVASGLAGRVLVGAAEVNSRDADFTDRTAIWFGDGAGAIILEPCAPGTGILATYVAGTGEGSEILTVPAGGSREPITPEGLAAGRHRLYMDGRAVFPFGVQRMVESIRVVTSYLGMSPNHLDWIVPHQANLRIIESAADQLSFPMARVYTNLDRVGNTAGASVLLALSEACVNGTIRPGDLVATVSFGGGLAWGAQVIRVNHAQDFDSA